jgi:hypothetical protein
MANLSQPHLSDQQRVMVETFQRHVYAEWNSTDQESWRTRAASSYSARRMRSLGLSELRKTLVQLGICSLLVPTTDNGRPPTRVWSVVGGQSPT